MLVHSDLVSTKVLISRLALLLFSQFFDLLIVTLEVSAGEFVGADADEDREGFQVQAQQGQFIAKLRSPLNAQTVQIRANIGTIEAFNQIQFETDLRSSLVTGVIDLRIGGKGTNFYKSFRDFLPPDKDNSTGLDFHSSVFATGKVGDGCLLALITAIAL